MSVTSNHSTLDAKRSADEFVECLNGKRLKKENVIPDHESQLTAELAAKVVNELDLDDYRNFRVKEEQVGITEFVSANKGFKCEIKQRFSDFIVHEIANDGQIIELTDLNEPSFDYENPDSPAIVDDEILELVPDEMREKLEKLNTDECSDDSNNHVSINVNDLDKYQRTRIHKFLNRYKNCESSTETVDNKKEIKVIRKTSGSVRNQHNSGQSRWQKNLPHYLHFALYQENKGTTDAVADLAKKLHISSKNITYAGLKDKRAISTQQCALYKILPNKLIEFNKRASQYKFPSAVGNFKFRDVPLFLGDAIGNKFEIVLRDVVYELESDVTQAFENTRKHGFINYFGIQRFGHSEYPAYRVGIAIIKKNYKEAIDTVLRYRQKDIQPAPYARQKKTFNECLKIYRETNDAKTAFKEFYWKSTNEGHLLKGLSLFGTNYLNAFGEIPRNNRSFYCHSFQSFVWNQIASYRFRTYGLKVINGDLAIKKKDLLKTSHDETELDNMRLDMRCKDGDDQLGKLNYIREFENEDVVVINDSNIDQYTIYDIVLPLIGPNVRNPENLVHDEIKRILEQLEITEEQLASVGDQFFVKGRYRRLMTIPVDLKHEIVKYDDNTIRVCATDLDKLNDVKSSVENVGSKIAIKLEVCLPSSSYATVLVRELSRQNC